MQTEGQILVFKLNKFLCYLSRSKYKESAQLLNEIERTCDKKNLAANAQYLLAKATLLIKINKQGEF